MGLEGFPCKATGELEQVVDPLLCPQRLTSPRSRLRAMRSDRQPVAIHGNGFRLFEPFSGPSHLPPVATGCARSAP
jgi:hypothetical protein